MDLGDVFHCEQDGRYEWTRGNYSIWGCTTHNKVAAISTNCCIPADVNNLSTFVQYIWESSEYVDLSSSGKFLNWV